jgi:hypothetical protein
MARQMTPAEAVGLLLRRRIEEIKAGRPVEELWLHELDEAVRLEVKLLRLHGAPLPRFETEAAENEWLDSDEGLETVIAVANARLAERQEAAS